MKKNVYLLNKEIVLIDWDWPDEKGPKCVEATITEELEGDTYRISLNKPVILFDGSSHRQFIISGRHKGYPVSKIFPSCIRKMFIFKHPLSRIITPLVAVNISTEDKKLVSIACVYLKALYLKAGGTICE